MNFVDNLMEKWGAFCEKAQPIWDSVVEIAKGVWDTFAVIFGYIFKIRKIILAVPVVWGAIYLAIYNQTHLPAVVGFELLESGDFGIQVSRFLAVFGPLLVTLVCLLLMFCSKRVLTPWVVSMFSLVLPVVILLLNTFSA